MIAFTRMADGLVRLALVLASVFLLAACGSGAVSAPPVVVTPGPVSISPDAATLYSDLPTTFFVSGGTGTYVVTSSDQSVIPVIGVFSGSSLTVVPSSVPADTVVTLQVRDAAGTGFATALVTVKPRTVNNTVTITPSASQAAACGTAICSGGDAEVRVVLTQAGIALRGRLVRFDVVSGDFRIITSAPGAPESTELSGTTTTDDTGTARMRIRVLAEATGQTGLLQITDVSSGFTQRTSVAIAPSSNAPLNAQPTEIRFIGRDSDTCATQVSADVIVFGGRPPYSISQPGTFAIAPMLVLRSGDRFTVSASGQCTAGSPIAVVDANGATVTVTAINTVAAITVASQPLVVSPTSVTLENCNSVATVAIAGGLGPGSYFATSGNISVLVQIVHPNTGRINRQGGTPATTAISVPVAFSDGKSIVDVTVFLDPTARGPC